MIFADQIKTLSFQVFIPEKVSHNESFHPFVFGHEAKIWVRVQANLMLWF